MLKASIAMGSFQGGLEGQPLQKSNFSARCGRLRRPHRAEKRLWGVADAPNPTRAVRFARSSLSAWLLLNHFPDLADGVPIANGHRDAEQLLGAGRELGAAHSLGRVQIEYLA